MVYLGPSRGCETCKRRRKKVGHRDPECMAGLIEYSVIKLVRSALMHVRVFPYLQLVNQSSHVSDAKSQTAHVEATKNKPVGP
jgi:hypothetical protein